ncbi:MAG: Cof-type HAD-IIB family hydrolase [Solobacterium sp.]|nr:Cof-type HAD-IIB family hydrolase [Solobacterium sp.]
MISKLTALFCDIDGTLTVEGGSLMPKTKQALEKLHSQGVLIGIASGRPVDGRILGLASDWGLSFEFDAVIGMNGGELWDRFHEGVEKYHLLKKECTREILTFLDGLDINAYIFEDGYDCIAALRMDETMKESIRQNHSHVEIGDRDRLCARDTGKLEVRYRPEDEEKVMRVVNAHHSDEWTAVRTYTGTVEFVDPAVNKGLALRMFSQRCGIPAEEIMGIGDMDNDIGLVRDAGWGVCMISGSEKTKAAADDITEYDVLHDGVGEYLEKNWFSA